MKKKRSSKYRDIASLLRFFGKKEWFLLSVVLFFTLFAALLEGTSFSLILLGFMALMQQLESLTFFTRVIENLSLHFSSIQLFSLAIGGGILAQIVRSSFSYLGQKYMTYCSTHFQAVVQKKIFAQIFRFSYSQLNHYALGDLIEYAKTPILCCQLFFDACNRMLISLLLIGSLLSIMLYLSWSLTLVTLLLFAFALLAQKLLFKKLEEASTDHTQTIANLSAQATQTLYGMRTILIFHQERAHLERLHQMTDHCANSSKQVHIARCFFTPLNEVIAIGLLGALVVLAPFLMNLSSLALMPALLTFLSMSYRLGTRSSAFMEGLANFTHQSAYLFRIAQILKEEDKEFSPAQGRELLHFNEALSFQNLHFRYPTSTEDVLKNLSFKIPKGRVTAFVGPSGAGKSSILDLLVRLYEPTAGQLSIDSVALSQYSIYSWRRRLGVVSQDIAIFNESIAENIRFGAQGAAEEEIKRAAEAAGAAHFIAQLPEGYATVVGERGYRLSGGEKQRLALARALLRNPDILLLDEATSHLDSHSESLIQKALERLRGEKTLIIVAHRLSTIAEADKIYFLRKGEIIEEGSHAELLEKRGAYHAMWSLQSLAEKEEPKQAQLMSENIELLEFIN